MKSISAFIRRHFGFYYESPVSRFKRHPIFRIYRSVRIRVNFALLGFYIEKRWNAIEIHILFFTVSINPDANVIAEDTKKMKECRDVFIQSIRDTEEAAKIAFESITANFIGLYRGTKFHLAPFDPDTGKAISIKDLYVTGTQYSSELDDTWVGASVFLGIVFDEGPARETVKELIRLQRELNEYRELRHI